MIHGMLCQVLKNQRNDPLLVATNASNTPDSPTLVLRFPPGIPSVSLRWVCLGTSDFISQISVLPSNQSAHECYFCLAGSARIRSKIRFSDSGICSAQAWCLHIGLVVSSHCRGI